MTDIQALLSKFSTFPDNRPQQLKDLTSLAPTTEDYCRFFFHLTKELKPNLCLETGTDRGRSAAHLALGNPDGMVITIDIDPVCKGNVDSLKIPNISSLATDSLAHVGNIPDGCLDILFLDSLHTYEHTIAEWRAFQRKVKRGGLAFFDDIHLDGGMERFWNEVTGNKVDISHLHFSGFGAVLL
jgi:predicted O-methyltransferase YrrM